MRISSHKVSQTPFSHRAPILSWPKTQWKNHILGVGLQKCFLGGTHLHIYSMKSWKVAAAVTCRLRQSSYTLYVMMLRHAYTCKENIHKVSVMSQFGQSNYVNLPSLFLVFIKTSFRHRARLLVSDHLMNVVSNIYSHFRCFWSLFTSDKDIAGIRWLAFYPS